MNEYYTPPTPPAAGTRARSVTISDVIDSVDAGFDNIPADLTQSIEALQTAFIEQLGLPPLEAGGFLRSADGLTLDWELPIPLQTGHNGELLTTNGTAASWAAQYPTQVGNSGKALITNGSTVGWELAIPLQTANSGKFLTTNGTVASWDLPLPIQTGNSGKTLQTNGTVAAWNDIPRAGSISAVATGSITAGNIVVLNSDNTVSVCTSQAGALSDPFIFEAHAATHISSAYDSVNQRIILAFVDPDDGDGKAVVGEISGTSILFGTTVSFETGTVYRVACCYNSSSGKVVIAFQDGGTSADARVGTVDPADNSISFGTTAPFFATSCKSISICDDPAHSCVAICFSDTTGSNICKAIVGTVAGTDISFGSAATFESAYLTTAEWGTSCCYDSEYEKIICASASTTGYISARVGAISGTSISFPGSSLGVALTVAGTVSAAYDSSKNRVILAYKSSGGTGGQSSMLDVVSGTDVVNLGNANFEASASNYFSCVYDSTNDRVVIGYQGGSTYGKTIPCTGTSTTLSFTISAETFLSSATTWVSLCDCGALGKLVIAYNNGTSCYAKLKSSSLNISWIGIADDTVTNGQTLTVNTIGGVNTHQTGLTTGTTYYIDIDGLLTATPTSYGIVGRALSATSLLITKGGIE